MPLRQGQLASVIDEAETSEWPGRAAAAVVAVAAAVAVEAFAAAAAPATACQSPVGNLIPPGPTLDEMILDRALRDHWQGDCLNGSRRLNKDFA